MRTRLILLLMLLAAAVLSAQMEPDTLWSRRYMFEGDDVAEDVVLMPDGGFLMTGGRLTLRTDSQGDTLWTRSYGNHGFDELHTITQIDDDYILTGRSYESGQSFQGWCLRIQENGDTLWSRSYGADGWDAFRRSVWLDGTLLVAGDIFDETGWKIWLAALSETGDSLWSQTFDLEGNENVNDVIVTADGALLICGVVNTDDGQDGFALKCSTGGDSLWTQIYGGESDDSVRKVACTPQGDFIYCGYSGSFGAVNMDVWLFKTSASGEINWNRVYGDVEFEYARSLYLTPDDNIIVVGSSNSNEDTNQDFYITKRNADGSPAWTRLLGGEQSDAAYAICQADSGGFVVAGRSHSYDSTDFDIQLYCFEGLHCDFFSNVQSGYQPLEVEFHSASTGSITEWRWDTDGDGIFDHFDPNPIIVYEDAGIYDITLVITDGTYVDSLRREAYIQVEANEPPQIDDFTPQDTLLSIQQGQQVHFHVDATDDHGILNYSWLLDDENMGISVTSWIHVFNDGGDFTVTCLISDGQFQDRVEWHVEVTTAADEPMPSIPATTGILHARPNPFNPSTIIRYQLHQRQQVRLDIYNIRGQKVATLLDEVMDAGTHEIDWSGTDSYGKPVSSGVYHLRMNAGRQDDTYKLLLLK